MADCVQSLAGSAINQVSRSLHLPPSSYFMLVVAKKTWSGTGTHCPLKCEDLGEVAIDGLPVYERPGTQFSWTFVARIDAPSISDCLFDVQAKNGSTWWYKVLIPTFLCPRLLPPGTTAWYLHTGRCGLAPRYRTSICNLHTWYVILQQAVDRQY